MAFSKLSNSELLETSLSIGRHALNCQYDLKEYQKLTIRSLLKGEDVFCSSPTGSGKSITYQLSPIAMEYMEERSFTKELFKAVTIIVKPLKALMEENVMKLSENGFRAIYLGDSCESVAEIISGNYDYIFGSPESLTGKYADLFKSDEMVSRIKLLVVDETRCIKQWGIDDTFQRQGAFRKAYAEIGIIRSSLGSSVPCLSLTATATKTTREAVIKHLGMNNCRFVIMDANKANIKYSVLNVDADHRKNFKWLVEDLKKNKIDTQRHIIFCTRVDDMKNLFRFFQIEMGPAQYFDLSTENETSRMFAMYHQKTDPEIQENVRLSFADLNGRIRILFCTIAFGMGIDVQGVHTVIHYGPAKNIEEYLQESGRAGRDASIQSHALLLNYKGSTRGRFISAGMRKYIKDVSMCKRKILLAELQDGTRSNSTPHTCCSYCSHFCQCQCQCEGGNQCTCETKCLPDEETKSTAEVQIVKTYKNQGNDNSTDESDDSFELFDEISATFTASNSNSDSDTELQPQKPQIIYSDSDSAL